jgi:hypothetical protein
MAATPFEGHPAESSFVFDIYHDGRNAAAPSPNLPGGACNFVDLTPGAGAAKCGCRRFWSRPNPGTYGGGGSPDQASWCMCTHHACFHDDGSSAAAAAAAATVAMPPPPVAIGLGQENTRPLAGREPLSPVQDLSSFQMPSIPGMADTFSFGDIIPRTEELPLQATTRPDTAQESAIPDTLSWGHYIQTQDGILNTTTLPTSPSHCLLPSQPPSTASSSQRGYIRPFAGKGLTTLSGVAQQTALETFAAPTPRAGSPTQESNRQLDPGDDKYRQLSETIQSHEIRLDKLETSTGNTTIAAPSFDDERHEQVDLRVTDLEARVEEVERRLNDDASTVTTTTRDDNATISVASTSHHNPGGSAEMLSQLQSLQAQVDNLRASSLPTYHAPWEVEVVFLPFPLKGVWMEAAEFATQRDGPIWPATMTRQTPDPHSPALEWQDVGHERWLSPRACAPGRLVDRRLKSRGLIKTVSVRGGDARSVHLAMNAAFPTVLKILSHPSSRRNSGSSEKSNLLGLQHPWVPLRKIHKDSRLRFLTPAEMVSPALWDVPFLQASVVMKATGTWRLYVTTPDAYLQEQQTQTGWTWARVRELGRVVGDSQSSTSSHAEEDAEGCWAWNEKLDEPVVPPPGRSDTSGSEQQFFTVPSPALTSPALTSPAMAQQPSPILTVRDPLVVPRKPPHIRTSSIPLAASETPGFNTGKLRSSSSQHITITSYDRRSSPYPISARPSPRMGMSTSPVLASSIYKRRGASGHNSPALRQRPTPRWSLSRSPSLAPLDRFERAASPFFYATPHSTGGRGPVSAARGGGDEEMAEFSGSETDGSEMEIFEDEEEDDEDDEEWVPHQQRGGVAPEDVAWQGIPDNMSDGENMDPEDVDITEDDGFEGESCWDSPDGDEVAGGGDADGDADSGKVDFKIHEDGDDGMGGQWE